MNNETSKNSSNTLTLSEIIEKLNQLLNSDEIMHTSFKGANIYFLNKNHMKELKYIESAALELYNNNNRKRKAKDYMYKIAKILNPSSPAYSYKLNTSYKYVYVNSKDKIDSKYSGYYPAWSNTKTKQIQELIHDKNIEGVLKEKINLLLTKELEFRKEFHTQIFNDKKLLDDVFRSTYPFKQERGAIYFNMIDTSYKQAYLREEVPNILWYEQASKTNRTDFKMEDLHANSEYLFYDLYISAGGEHNEFYNHVKNKNHELKTLLNEIEGEFND